MISHQRGVVYYVVLSKDIDQYLYRPDIEKSQRYSITCKIEVLKDYLHKKRNIIVVVPMDQSDDRLLNSRYYKNNKERWSDKSQGAWVLYQDLVADITLSDKENAVITEILNHPELVDNIENHGWYDVSRYV